jgi:hypothetical protein
MDNTGGAAVRRCIGGWLALVLLQLLWPHGVRADLWAGFVENRGQKAPEVRYYMEVGGGTIFFCEREVVAARSANDANGPEGAARRLRLPDDGTWHIVPAGRRIAKLNFFLGNDPARWYTDVRTYDQLRYEHSSSGTQLVLFASQSGLSWAFPTSPATVARDLLVTWQGPAGDPARIGLDTGLRRLRGLLSEAANGRAPRGANAVRQHASGRTPPDLYPRIINGTYLGGSSEDYAYGVALAPDGDVVVAGWTKSTNFPTKNALDDYNPCGGCMTAFVARLSPRLDDLICATYLGGSSETYGDSLAVDGDGAMYVAGTTTADDFPTVNPLQARHGGGGRNYYDGFLTKLAPEGNQLLYSTYFGGGGDDEPYVVLVDQIGNMYLVGDTSSSNLPVENAAQAALAGEEDLFAVKFTPAGDAIEYCTYFGGDGDDDAGGGAAALGPGGSFGFGGRTLWGH